MQEVQKEALAEADKAIKLAEALQKEEEKKAKPKKSDKEEEQRGLHY